MNQSGNRLQKWDQTQEKMTVWTGVYTPSLFEVMSLEQALITLTVRMQDSDKCQSSSTMQFSGCVD